MSASRRTGRYARERYDVVCMSGYLGDGGFRGYGGGGGR